jgi:molybdenum cofactor cytidylyltransferase/nicotine blue oxidoreductase
MPQASRGDVAIALLAAGRGSRLGGDDAKPLVEWRGRPLLAWALDAATASHLDPIVVITGYERGAVRAVLGDRSGEFRGVDEAHNRRWRRGIASSLVTAIDFVDGYTRVGAVCIGLADQPLVGADAYQRLAAAYQDGAELAVATYGGRRGNPVLLARSLWPEARELEGDVGARVLMQRHEVVEVACDDTGSPADVDTYADLHTLDQLPLDQHDSGPGAAREPTTEETS